MQGFQKKLGIVAFLIVCCFNFSNLILNNFLKLCFYFVSFGTFRIWKSVKPIWWRFMNLVLVPGCHSIDAQKQNKLFFILFLTWLFLGNQSIDSWHFFSQVQASLILKITDRLQLVGLLLISFLLIRKLASVNVRHHVASPNIPKII